MKKQLFIIDPPASLDPKMDTSMQMMHAMLRDGQKVAWTTVQNMFWDISSKTAKANIFWSESGDLVGENSGEAAISLDLFDGFHMRQEPPVDHLFSYGLWLLQTLPQSKKIFNTPRSLLDLNEKLITFAYPDQCMDSLVTCDYQTAINYMESIKHSTFVLKPLDSFGGRGVIKVDYAKEEGREQIQAYFSNGTVPRMIQPFNEAIKDGELRVFTVMGEDIAWCLKKPKQGGFLANTRNGAELYDVEPDLQVAKSVKEVAKDLLGKGVYICGFDVLGGKISEINITSPRLLMLDQKKSEEAYGRFSELVLQG